MLTAHKNLLSRRSSTKNTREPSSKGSVVSDEQEPELQHDHLLYLPHWPGVYSSTPLVNSSTSTSSTLSAAPVRRASSPLTAVADHFSPIMYSSALEKLRSLNGSIDPFASHINPELYSDIPHIKSPNPPPEHAGGPASPETNGASPGGAPSPAPPINGGAVTGSYNPRNNMFAFYPDAPRPLFAGQPTSVGGVFSPQDYAVSSSLPSSAVDKDGHAVAECPGLASPEADAVTRNYLLSTDEGRVGA